MDHEKNNSSNSKKNTGDATAPKQREVAPVEAAVNQFLQLLKPISEAINAPSRISIEDATKAERELLLFDPDVIPCIRSAIPEEPAGPVAQWTEPPM